MEHTPLKAILDDVPIYPMWKLVDPEGNVIVTIEAEDNDKEWATHIMGCVNSHDVLVEALEGLVNDCDVPRGRFNPPINIAMSKARAALAKIAQS